MKLEKRWDEQSVVREILAEYRAGNDLSYSGTLRRAPALLKAGERTFGNWKTAIMESGLNYDEIRKKRRWNRQQIIDRIIELYDAGADLSWRSVSQKVDPALAAAVLHAGRFSSWEDALRSAGLKPQLISKYQHWSDKRIESELQKLIVNGHSLTLPVLSKVNPPLLAAIYRRGMKVTDIKESLLIDKLISDLGKKKDDIKFVEMMEKMMVPESISEMPSVRKRELVSK
jgi:hypothetical protein